MVVPLSHGDGRSVFTTSWVLLSQEYAAFTSCRQHQIVAYRLGISIASLQPACYVLWPANRTGWMFCERFYRLETEHQWLPKQWPRHLRKRANDACGDQSFYLGRMNSSIIYSQYPMISMSNPFATRFADNGFILHRCVVCQCVQAAWKHQVSFSSNIIEGSYQCSSEGL